MSLFNYLFGTGTRIDQTVDVPLLVNTQILEARDVVLQFYTFEVPPDHIWIVSGASLLNDNRAASGYANIKYHDKQFTTPQQATTAASTALNCLHGILPPLIMVAGEKITLYNHNFVAGDVNTFMLKISEFKT